MTDSNLQPQIAARLKRIRSELAKSDFDGLLVSNGFNRHYGAGFLSTAGYLLITAHTQLIATDSRYTEIAQTSCPGWRICDSDAEFQWLKDQIAANSVKKLAVEAEDLNLLTFRQIQKATTDTELCQTDGFLLGIRAVKDQQELATLQKAVEIGDSAFEKVLSQMTVGQTEKELARLYELNALKLGADGLSFPPIVGAGANAARPHHHPTDRQIGEGETIVFDCGVIYNGFCSDLTRTVVLGKADDRIREVHNTVYSAQQAAAQGIAAGMDCVAVDALARDVIAKKGYGDKFIHGLGHGVGLEIHEWPRLSPKSTDTLQEGMAFTIEPGIYIEGWGGVRIEDVFVLQNGKARALSNAARRELP